MVVFDLRVGVRSSAATASRVGESMGKGRRQRDIWA